LKASPFFSSKSFPQKPRMVILLLNLTGVPERDVHLSISGISLVSTGSFAKLLIPEAKNK